jgi:hypothetical protein
VCVCVWVCVSDHQVVMPTVAADVVFGLGRCVRACMCVCDCMCVRVCVSECVYV